MKISYNWLKWHVPEIPEASKLADVFTYHLCEVEGIEKKGDDTIFDLNILPNRAHDLLSHQGVARELAGQLGIKFTDPTPKYKLPESKSTNLKIDVKSSECRRYMGRIVRNVKVGPSPDWVKTHLESIGARSINNIVDATNIIMYDCGQPTHAFDLDKLASEKIIVRNAKKGEKITLLAGEEKELEENDLVIADEKNALAIAGVKGGKRSEVDANTKNILLEVANFRPVSVRKTSRRLGILTDSSKRFENNLSAELCDFAMRELSGLLVEYGTGDFEEIVDIYPNPEKGKQVSFSLADINNKLGTDIKTSGIKKILESYQYKYKEKDGVFEVTVPPLRLDLEGPHDFVEEIGRILGYDKIIPEIPKIDFQPKQNETAGKILAVRQKLLALGFSEVMTYSFRDKGKTEVLASASDKKFLRANLALGLRESYELNRLNAPLLGLKEIKIFEIGTVFSPDGESIRVATADKSGIKEETLENFFKSLDLSLAEFTPESYKESGAKFKTWSNYPFVARDIALWTPSEVKSDEVAKIIKDAAGPLVVVGPDLFDEFKKENRTSYAFRLVFQSGERTLTDLEINKIMAKISEKLEQKGWQIR
jgi:phenylalanyl-tRNA synthetase beta chain